MHIRRLLCILVVGVLFVCGSAQATHLQITVLDEATSVGLSDVSLYVDGDYVGMTGSNGLFSYTHSMSESYRLKATRSGYNDWVGLVGGSASSVLIEMSRKSEVLAVDLFDGESLQPVRDAVVQVHGDGFDGSESTDASGRADFQVKAGGLYNIEIRAQSYYSLSRTVQMESSGRTVQYWIYRNDKFAALVKDSQTRQPIADATVTIDTGRAGTTGADGLLPLHLQRERRYLVVVEKPDYQTYQAEHLITADDVLLTILLSKSTYPVTVSVYDETRKPVEQADVFINGTWQGKTDRYGRYGLPSVEAGTYMVEVSAPGYTGWSDTCQITRTGEDIIVDLAYARADVMIKAEDADGRALAGTAVLIDGRPAGITDAEGTLRTVLKSSDSYNVSASLEGYRFASVALEVPLGRTAAEATVRLEREFDPVVLIGAFVLLLALIAAGFFYKKRRGAKRLRSPKTRSL
ncbi:hypothetical protein ABH15_05780 [Methanoculleus taiwanensis]|uniref:PEGA domain-containing protein n=1 Tax=Methanoculleus taiwanensis TaxID=1550565 RepID=A0A498GYF2_9EURY|nr:carboxypeptidase-like regulatory domain-containing protein [Methanoculleus taiwanensis]RXE55741.1 hypothetical protein ABH15_05780 [Methanoculleus taiwanensis]